MKNKKYKKLRYEKMAAGMSEYYQHLDLRFIDDLDDEGFEYMIKKVKGVDMLDLNETAISNDSIALLTRLEYVKELRLKSCRNVDDGCIADLNKLTQLEFLHLNHTGVTIDGLLLLTALQKLHTLLFTADNVDEILPKIIQLQALFPACELVINSKPFRNHNDENTEWNY